MNSPISMKMDMHMFGAMYAPLDNLTLMLMTGYSEKEMTQQRMRMRGSGRFDVNSSGVTDTRISGLIKLFNNNSILIKNSSIVEHFVKFSREILTYLGAV